MRSLLDAGYCHDQRKLVHHLTRHVSGIKSIMTALLLVEKYEAGIVRVRLVVKCWQSMDRWISGGLASDECCKDSK